MFSFPIVGALASPFIGSFIGSVAVRLPDGRSIVAGRSACDRCGTTLGPLDMVPVVSWISLRGHCRSCSGPINPLHPAAETLAIVLAGWAAFVVPASVLGVSLLFGWILLAISLIDLSRQVIPDRLSIPLAAAGLIVAALLDRTTITDHLLGAMGGFLSLWPVAIAYRHMRGRTGMGGGDPKLFGAIGAWVAWQGLPGVLLYASLSGLIHALLLFLWGRGMTRATRIPFGPHLALGAWLVWLYGPLVIG